MKFIRRHWFKILIILPFIPVSFLIYSLSRFAGIDESLRFLASFVPIVASLLLFCLGVYFEMIKGNVNSKKIRLRLGKLRFGIAEIARVIFGVLAIALFFIAFNIAIMSMRVVDVIETFAEEPSTVQFERAYSLVTTADFDVNNQGSYGRIGITNERDEAKQLAVEEFILGQNFIPNPVSTIFDSETDLMDALYDNEVDAVIVNNNFIQTFDKLENFKYSENDTLILDQFTIETETDPRVELDPREPFSILLLGLNSRDDMESGNINTLMLLTINLEDLSFTAVSIPRDSHVEIPCLGYAKDKLSHTNLDGPECAVGAIEHMFNMEIPYYVKLNFTGFMEIIDVLGGIEVDVPIAFSEQDSRRRFGRHRIHLEAGPQRLNAEEALALTRHRKSFLEQDFNRVENQQLVLQAMLREMFDQVDGLSDILPLLEVIGHHVETNLSAYEITTIGQYMLGLLQGQLNSDLMENIHFINMVILGDTPNAFVRNYGYLSVVIPWLDMIEEARRLMMINLGIDEPDFNFTFEFDGFARPSRRQWVERNESFGNDPWQSGVPVYE